MVKTWASTELEQSLARRGKYIVAGTDEVGRGAWAGPLTVAVVVLPHNYKRELCDSKFLPPLKRAELSEVIAREAIDYAISDIDAAVIDEVGLARALRIAYLEALANLACNISEIIVDGPINYFSDFEIGLAQVRGDQLHSCVSAASIIAKVHRDALMTELDTQYPEYAFRKNVGYGTPAHQSAITEFGFTDLHRRSFKINA